MRSCQTDVLLEIPPEIIPWRLRHAVEFLIDHFAFTQPAIYKKEQTRVQ